MSTTETDPTVSFVADKYNDIYSAQPAKWSSPLRDAFACEIIEQFYGIPDTLLDIGCGNGHTIASMQVYWPGTKFTGIDISEVALALARIKAPKASFYTTELTELKDTFDAITLMGVAEHFQDWNKDMGFVYSLLKDGGALYLEIPNNLAISGRTEEGWFSSDIQTEWHLRRSTWERMILDAGFSIAAGLRGMAQAWEFIWMLRKA